MVEHQQTETLVIAAQEVRPWDSMLVGGMVETAGSVTELHGGRRLKFLSGTVLVLADRPVEVERRAGSAAVPDRGTEPRS